MKKRTITSKCLVSPSKRTMIDYVATDGYSYRGQLSLDEIRKSYPDAVVMEVTSALLSFDEPFITNPRFCSEKEFVEAKNRINRCAVQTATTESFFSEHVFGSVSKVFVRVGKRYLSFQDHVSLSHKALCDKVVDFVRYGQA